VPAIERERRARVVEVTTVRDLIGSIPVLLYPEFVDLQGDNLVPRGSRRHRSRRVFLLKRMYSVCADGEGS